MANVNIDNDQLQAVIAKAIIDSLTPERKEELLGNAVKSLLETRSNPGSSYDRTTVIQAAFNDAARNVAVQIATEHLKTEEVQAAIRKLVSDAVTRALKPESEGYDPLVEKIADAVRKALVGDRY